MSPALQHLESISPTLSRHVLVFSDFDGTISTSDTGTALIDHCMGRENREKLDQDILHGRRTFRDAVAEMWSSVRLTQSQAHDLLEDIKVDPTFATFLGHCDSHKVPVTVLSAGLDILVRPMLQAALGPRAEALETVVNYGNVLENGQWTIRYLDDTPHGHDKSASITRICNQYQGREGLASAESPLVVFIGDGVSDVPCARVCDRLYAKRGKDLEKYCAHHGLDHVVFDTFADVLSDFAMFLEAQRGGNNGQ